MLKDLLIIGGGPAGDAAARAAAERGDVSTVIVERDAFGGTCTNRGCIPTKFLLARSEALRRDGGPGAGASWGKLVAHKAALVQGLSRSIEKGLGARGVAVVRGSARFRGPHEVEIVDSGGSVSVIEARSIILATGSEPAQLTGFPSDGGLILTSTDALSLARPPRSLAVIGSGAVGAEFATIFNRVGVAVTIVEAAERLFPAEDPEVDRVFRGVYERMGVRVCTGDPVRAVEKRDEGVRVLLQSGAAIEADQALVGIGRRLATAGIGCEEAGIRLGARGEVLVDDDLRTSQPHIFAAGDATGRMLLAHAASYMGEYAARRSLGMEFGRVPYRSIPWATFTSPEVAAVGLSETAAARDGLDCRAAMVPMMENVKARIDRTTEGFFKVVAERESGKVLGGTIVGVHASDLIHILALAVHQGMTIGDLRGFSFLHPSIAESIADLVSSIIKK